MRFKQIDPSRRGRPRSRIEASIVTIEKHQNSYLHSIVRRRTLGSAHRPSGREQFHESDTVPDRQQPREEGSLVGRRHPVRGDGVLRRRLRPEGHRHPVCVPDRPAARRRRDRGRRCRSGRVVDRDLDGRLDRPPDRPQALPGEGLPGRCRSRHRPVHRPDRLRHRPLRGRLDREPDLVDHRQRLRLQGAQVAAPRGHAHPDCTTSRPSRARRTGS